MLTTLKTKTNRPEDANPERRLPDSDLAYTKFGCVLMWIAILDFLVMIIQDKAGHPSVYSGIEVRIIFFIALLGFVCIQPDLLKDANKNLITMYIIVFIMANVIGMLMLHIGWASKTFNDTAMTGYWVTIIGFVFGGRMARSYIENKYPSTDGLQTSGAAPVSQIPTLINADVAKTAADQNRKSIQKNYPNVSSISDTVAYDEKGSRRSVVAFYVRDAKTAGLPKTIIAKLADQTTHNVPTEIIPNVGDAQIQSLQQSRIYGTYTSGEFGSVGAMVSSADDDDFRGVITAGHVYSNGDSTNMQGTLTGTDITPVTIDKAAVANWCFQLISPVQDIAIAQLIADYQPSDFISFKAGSYQVGHADVTKTQVTVVSNIRGIRMAWILDYNVPRSIKFDDNKTIDFTAVILIGSSNVRDDSEPVSERGDSGGCVYVSDNGSNKLVGIILGRDDKFTFVLPVGDTLNTYDFNLI